MLLLILWAVFWSGLDNYPVIIQGLNARILPQL